MNTIQENMKLLTKFTSEYENANEEGKEYLLEQIRKVNANTEELIKAKAEKEKKERIQKEINTLKPFSSTINRRIMKIVRFCPTCTGECSVRHLNTETGHVVCANLKCEYYNRKVKASDYKFIYDELNE